MGIGYSFRSLMHGDFANAFNGLLVSDDVLSATDQTTSALEAQWQRQQAEGLIDAQQSVDLQSQLAPAANSDAYWQAAGGNTPLQEFNQTVIAEANQVPTWLQRATNRVTGFGFRLIPWQVWILLFVLLCIWLGPIWKPFMGRLVNKK